MIPSYDVGDMIQLGNTTGNNNDGSTREAFANIAGVATDPTTVTLRMRKLPTGTPLVYNWPLQGSGDGVLIKEATGRFYVYYTFVAGDDGDWAWELKGTGAVQTSESGRLHVRWSPF